MFKDQGITRRRFISLGGVGTGVAVLSSISDSWIRTAIGQQTALPKSQEDFAMWYQEQDRKLSQAEVTASKRYLRRVPYEERKAQGLLDDVRGQVANPKMGEMRAEARKLWKQFWEKGDLYADETQEVAYRARAILEVALESEPENLYLLEDMAQIILASNPHRLCLSYDSSGRTIRGTTKRNFDLTRSLLGVRERQWEIILKQEVLGKELDFNLARHASYDMLRVREEAHMVDSTISASGSGQILNWRIDHAEEGGWQVELPYMLHWLANIEAGESFAFRPGLTFLTICRHYDRNAYRSLGLQAEANGILKMQLKTKRYFGLHHVTTRVPALGNKTGLELIDNYPRNPDIFRMPLVEGSWDWVFAREGKE